MRDAVAQPGLGGTASSPVELAEFIRVETERSGRVVRERNLRVEG